jgi:GT2 family glycosyltransferase
MLLPAAPSLQDLRAHTPSIARVPKDILRPFWSVMIPTYNSGDYLKRTLESVLCQDPGPEQMQIEVVDGCSTKDDPQQITKDLGKGRVAFHRLASNHGPAHTFNVCIQRSLGHWVHILHGDDMVLPNFYDSYQKMIQTHPGVRVVLGQAIMVDEHDRWTDVYGATPPLQGGILNDFKVRQATQQLVLAPSITVRRDAYEEIGGFCTLFSHVTDWDMWFRLGLITSVACVPKPLALYRIHGDSDTSKREISAENIQERYFLMTSNLVRLNGSAGSAREAKLRRSRLASLAEVTAWRLDHHNCTEGRYNQARWALMLEPSARRLIMLTKSWLKYRLGAYN